jgi:tetratricopeptide (TPR) repeat protein/tRNA A-37 threonylcarbamoyl transferase component Bud32
VTGEFTLSSQPTAADPTQVLPEPEGAAPARGDLIGHFTIVDQLGAGGMGIVYAAYDVELNRKVAIKLLRVAPGGDQSIGRARLLREAQAMAQVDHPNVVTVFEVGKHRGDVYIAMEFIDGETFGAWRRRTSAGWREVVGVLEQAARGLVAAHAEGLVHRDFKPDNVMVGRDGRVRVMDFGIVRNDDGHPMTSGAVDDSQPAEEEELSAMGADVGASLASSMTLTAAGTIVGTPAYMAPEQFTREPTDARSDQFSFCVTLWEALFDERPFEGRSVLTLGMNVTAGVRRPTPTDVNVPGWLLRLCERGLSTDRSERFESMQALLEAIESGRRQSKRRWLAVGAATLLAGAAAFGVADAAAERRRVQTCEAAGQSIDEVWNEDAATRLRDAFEPLGETASARTLASATVLLDGMADDWSDARTQSCLLAPARSAEMMERATWCLDDRKQTLDATLETVAGTHDRAALLQFVPALSELGGVAGCLDEDALRLRALPPPSERAKVAALRKELAAVDALLLTAQFDAAVEVAQAMDARPDASSWAPFHAELSLRLGRALGGNGDLDAAESRLVDAYLEAVDTQSVDIASAISLELANVLGVQRQEPTRGMLWMRLAEVHDRARGEAPLRRAERLHRRSSLVRQLKRFDEAEAGYLEALELLEAELGPAHLLVARTRNNLGNLYEAVSRFDDAMTQFEAAVSIRKEALGDAHPDVAQTLVGMANTVGAMGDREKGLTLHRRALETYQAALGDDHVLVALAHGNLASAYLDLRQLDPALEHATRSAKIYEAQLGPLHAKTANALNSIGTIHHTADRLPEAKAYYERARLGLEATLGRGHERVAFVLFNLALIHKGSGEIQEARDLFQRALNIRETVYGRTHVLVADTLEEFAILEATNAHLVEARAMFDRTLAIRRELLGAGHPRVWSAVDNLALLNDITKQPQRSRALYWQVVTDWTEALGDDDPALALPLLGVAQLELDQKQPAAAVAPARRALALRNAPGQDAVSRAQAQFVLAQALAPEPRGATEESLTLARRALTGFGDASAQAKSRASVKAWLAARGIKG